MENNGQGIVVTFGNFKGGTGKTTNSAMLSYVLSDMGYKVLLCDQDPQANATAMYLKTKALYSDEIAQFDKTLMTAIQEEDLGQIVTEVKENLFLLPSSSDFSLYPRFLELKFPDDMGKRVRYFSKLIEPLKPDYDFIFIDVPPTISVITDAALYSSDFVVVVLQTQERSLQGAEIFTQYLQSLIDDYDANLDIIGVLPVLMKNGATVDLAILEYAKEVFGEKNLFENVVKNMERLKRFDMTGITKDDMHDRRVHGSYKVIANEFLNRLEECLSEVVANEQ